VYITDLASANGTDVNGETLGASSRVLNLGDRVHAGDSELTLVEPGMEIPKEGESIADADVDLGLSQQGNDKDADDEKSTKGSPLRLILWLVLVLVLGGSAAAILFVPMGSGETGSLARPLAPAKLWSVSYEKVEASTKNICRYAINVDNAGNIRAELDDVPESDRHIKKSAALSEKAKEELDRLSRLLICISWRRSIQVLPDQGS
jgi:flagellar basal body-associated protein FliL